PRPGRLRHEGMAHLEHVGDGREILPRHDLELGHGDEPLQRVAAARVRSPGGRGSLRTLVLEGFADVGDGKAGLWESRRDAAPTRVGRWLWERRPRRDNSDAKQLPPAAPCLTPVGSRWLTS